MRNNLTGFTLIELLVVLVITSITTSLLITGLNSTWNNFDKLLAKNLTLTSARLPAVWFENSIRGSVLYHPEKVYFRGDQTSMSFVTIASPNAFTKEPASLHWAISNQQDSFVLGFSVTSKQELKAIHPFTTAPRFEYLVAGDWIDKFEDQAGLLPDAVRIVYGNAIWAFATPQRPVKADVPSELPIVGKYEF